MCLHPRPVDPVPEETARVARAAFRKGNTYMRMRDELGKIFEDEDFAGLFPRRGQPAMAPWRLALVTVVQFAENLSDRQAADAVRGRIDLKYALSLELSDPGFDASVLSEFRARLVEGGAQRLPFELLLGRFREMGLVKGGGKQRIDSTHVLAAVRCLNRLELSAESLRLALDALARAAPGWLAAHVPAEWARRYARPFSNRNLPKGKDKREDVATSIGEDGFELLDAVYSSQAPDRLRGTPEIEILRRVWLQNYVRTAGEVRWRHSRTEGLPPVSSRIDTPVDPESRTAMKSSGSVRWLGYKVHFTETCDEGYPGLITHVETTAAPVPDGRVLAPVHEALGTKGMLPSTHIADSGYMGIEALLAARRDHDIELLGPVRENKHWQVREGKGFDLSNFEVDWERERVRCPEGKHSIIWSPTKDAYGRDIVDIQFSRADCGACPSLDSCVRYTPWDKQKSPKKKKQNPKRHLRVPARERYEALKAARERQRSEWYLAEYARRDGIEGTIARAVSACGLRRTRYRGPEKVHLGHALTAAALNFLRVGEWIGGTRRAPTPRSPFSKAMAAAA